MPILVTLVFMRQTSRRVGAMPLAIRSISVRSPVSPTDSRIFAIPSAASARQTSLNAATVVRTKPEAGLGLPEMTHIRKPERDLLGL